MENASEVEGQDVGNSTSLHNILKSILEGNQDLRKNMLEMNEKISETNQKLSDFGAKN
jgi:hypothetical protein